MSDIRNRQNLSKDEQALIVEVYNSSGRLDYNLTGAANDEVFHVANTVKSVGSSVPDGAATLAKQKIARLKVIADRK